MRLYVATFCNNSYRFVISADDINSASDKAESFIASNYSWYKDRTGYDMSVEPCDEDYVIQ